jgi:hypothetical protein
VTGPGEDDFTITGTTGVTSITNTLGATGATGPTGYESRYRRQYIPFAGDAEKYGILGPEHEFYKMIEERRLKGVTGSDWVKVAARGGAVNADAYFAEGGMAYSPQSPPPLGAMADRSFPTMAFTDGQGAIGYIAEPPGLSPYQAAGRDGLMPMPNAPSPAAAAPSMAQQGPLSAIQNRNAGPFPSPIGQNPNLGYSFGNGPLSDLMKNR